MLLSVVGGLVAGLLTYAALGRRYRDPGFTELSSAAADRYLGTSLTAWEFARAKLRGDPVYRAVLASGWLPRSGVLVDVGCGPGLLLALVAQAVEDAHERPVAAGRLAGCPRPTCGCTASSCVRGPPTWRATRWATTPRSRPATPATPRCPAAIDVVAIFDVLHLIDREAQRPLLARVAAAMPPGGDPAGARGRCRRRLALPDGAARQPRHRPAARALAAAVRVPHRGRVAGGAGRRSASTCRWRRWAKARRSRTSCWSPGAWPGPRESAAADRHASVDDGVLRRPVGVELIPGVRGLADAGLELVGEGLRRLADGRLAIDVVRDVNRRRPGRTRKRPDGSRTTEQGSSGAPVM